MPETKTVNGMTLTRQRNGAWTLLPPSTKPAPAAALLGAWNDWAQCWDSPGMSARELAAKFAAQDFQDSCQPRLSPSARPLNRAQMASFMAAMEDDSD